MSLIAGIDVGGTKCLGVVLDAQREVTSEHDVLHQVRNPTPRADKLVDALEVLAGQLGDVQSLGVGVPGLITLDGVMRASPNIPGSVDVAVGPELSKRLGRQVNVDNDGNLAALAEWRYGAARGAKNMWMVTLGTGIGGGHVVNGVVQRGVNGFAGEIGHIVVNPDGPRCTCGRKGCWEVYASGRGLRMLAAGEAGESVIARARNGDADAVTVLEAWARWVAIGLSNLTNVSDPDVIVIGGGVSEAADIVMPIVQRWFVETLYSPEQRKHPDLRVAQLGEHAGAIGAALFGAMHA
ncbi:MAG: ROK family protein [Actinobacteria bacterium]|nr:ROK family protein [Actinomycetota bacterium]NBR92728.1 ROK family protein [Actinomycetota bacterium]NBT21028.1 ROK family protein [Actinomycetota bacterium]NBY58314.1 ROK family protein [Actinomycetota bacterium]